MERLLELYFSVFAFQIRFQRSYWKCSYSTFSTSYLYKTCHWAYFYLSCGWPLGLEVFFIYLFFLACVYIFCYRCNRIFFVFCFVFFFFFFVGGVLFIRLVWPSWLGLYIYLAGLGFKKKKKILILCLYIYISIFYYW